MNTYIETIKTMALNNKYTKYYCNIIERALLRPQDRELLKQIYKYVESHHILPKCFKLGGEKDKENLVFLTAKEHFIVHLCATKMFISMFKNKMFFAFKQLRSSNKYQNRYMNSRLYEQIKPSFKLYIRLYNKNQVKYIDKLDKELQLSLLNNGWSSTMTPEYKVGRCGGMKGKKHSEETKLKISEANIGKPKLNLRGKCKSKESIQKQKNTTNKNRLENPEKYHKFLKELSERTKELHKQGLFSNNGMLGKHHSDTTKQIISNAQKEYWNKLKQNPDAYKEIIKQFKERNKKSWNNPERRERAKITSTKSYRKHNMLPQDYYNKKLKPLLYMGFLPTSITKYRLLDMGKDSIKRLIYKFGNEDDKKQFDINKLNADGANKTYIQFLEYQYNKYFKDKNSLIPLFTKDNLEIFYKEFVMNKISNTKVLSSYKGVSKHASKWRYCIQFNKINYQKGFNTELESAIEYDKKLIELRGTKAKTNFPIENYTNQLALFESQTIR